MTVSLSFHWGARQNSRQGLERKISYWCSHWTLYHLESQGVRNDDGWWRPKCGGGTAGRKGAIVHHIPHTRSHALSETAATFNMPSWTVSFPTEQIKRSSDRLFPSQSMHFFEFSILAQRHSLWLDRSHIWLNLSSAPTEGWAMLWQFYE